MRKSVRAVRTLVIFAIILLASWVFWPVSYEDIDLSPPETPEVETSLVPDVTDIQKPIQEVTEKVVLPPEQGERPLGPSDAYLQICVIHNETGEPVEGAQIDLNPETEDDEKYYRFDEALEAQGWGNGSHCTDSSGVASVRLPTGIPFNLQVETPDFLPFKKLAEALQRGEHRKVLVEVGPLIFYGRVVENSPVRQPLQGIRITFGGQDSNQVLTDSSGLFSLGRGLSDPSYLSIRDKRYGPVLVELMKGHETPESALLIKLDPAAVVYGKVLGTAGPEMGALVNLSTRGYLISQGHEYVYPDDQLEWKIGTDSTGSYRLEGLPPNAELKTEITLKGRKPVLMRERLMLDPGEERRIDWTLGVLATVRGRVIDQDGHPVAGVPVIAMAQDMPRDDWNKIPDDQPVMLGRMFDSFGETMTEKDGAFELSNLPLGRMLIGAFPYIHRQYIVKKDELTEESLNAHSDVCPVGMILNLTEDSAVREITLKVHRGLSIRGSVLDADMSPVNSVSVYAYPENGILGILDSPTDEEGRFEIGPLLPGKYSLQASDFSLPDSNVVEAEVGDENVLLQLGVGGEIHGRISVEANLNPEDVLVWLNSREKGLFGGRSVNADGTFSFEGREPGLYDLYAYLDDRWVGVCLGVSVTLVGKSEEVHITLEPAAKLILRFKGYEDLNFYCIEYKGYSIIHDTAGMDGFEKETVPPGPLRVVLYERIGEEEFTKKEIASKEVFVRAGEQKEVVFEKDG